MQRAGMSTALVALLAKQSSASASPINKVVQMLSDLQTKVIKEGEDAQKVYAEFAEWCEDRSSALGFEIKTGKEESSSLKASIAQEKSTILSTNMKIEDLAAALAIDEADLKAAMEIRTREQGVFVTSEKDLTSSIDMLQRAITIIEKEMKGGASMAQLKSASSIAQALTALVQAAAISSADGEHLTALLQSSDSDELSAPAGAVYDNQSGGILDTMNGILEKAEQQLADARNTETSNVHAFEMLKQSLEDEIKEGKKGISESKKALAASSEAKATAGGDLDATSKELSADLNGKEQLHHDCMTKAEEFEAETKSRGEELQALAEAKKIIKETTSGANSISYSFVQAGSQLSSGADLAHFEAVRLVRDLAQKQHSTALAQLAQRMDVAMQHNAGSSDPFGKVKNLIRDMLAKLESEAEADAQEKSWCDRNLADSRTRKEEKTTAIKKLNTKMEAMNAKSAQLKEEVAALQESLAKLAKAQLDMTKLRSEEDAAYKSNKADMEQGLNGVKAALKVLNEYYASEDKAHDAATGSSSGIIGLLEVCESDFSKGLAEINSDEESSIAAFEKETKENEIEKTTKDQDVKYKTKESKNLDLTVAELTGDRSTEQAELDAVSELLGKLEQRCVAKAETYEAQKARREAELAGLREALEILNSEAALVQRSSKRRSLRASLSA